MRVLKFFWQPDCPHCPEGKKLLALIKEKYNKEAKWFNVAEEEGMAEAAFYMVMSTPSFVLVDSSDEELKSWRGEVPSEEELVKEWFENGSN